MPGLRLFTPAPGALALRFLPNISWARASFLRRWRSEVRLVPAMNQHRCWLIFRTCVDDRVEVERRLTWSHYINSSTEISKHNLSRYCRNISYLFFVGITIGVSSTVNDSSVGLYFVVLVRIDRFNANTHPDRTIILSQGSWSGRKPRSHDRAPYFDEERGEVVFGIVILAAFLLFVIQHAFTRQLSLSWNLVHFLV